MELLLSGKWIGEPQGLYSAEILSVDYLTDLSELSGFEGFVVVSYDLTKETLGIPIKESGLPHLIAIELGKFTRVMARPSIGCSLRTVSSSLGELEFKRRVEKIKEYIAQGDVYQINLTSRFDFEVEGSPKDLFFSFYERQPVPYAFFLEIGDLFILSGSMELFLKKEGDLILSKPIKGTGRTSEEILSSEKERAENLMITDMMRNDLGRVSRTGSVKVEELFRVERYRTLCQMHSTVVGKTDKSVDEILRVTFPPASVTGAPKYRAVQIINELEPHPRGYYCGAAGLIKKNGDFTLSVLIRTAYGGGSKISYFAGCGIVWDSDPEKEWEELLLKTKAFYP